MKRGIRKLRLYVGIAALSLCLSGVAQGATLGKPDASVNKTVRLSAGKASTVDLSGPVADVLVANPAIADVGTLRANRLYIVGKTIGDTNVLAFDDQGNQLADVTVSVRVDDRTLSETIKEFFPEEAVHVKTVSGHLVLSGAVSTPSVANQVRDLARRFAVQTPGAAPGQEIVDLMAVENEQQVMLQVKVIEAKRTALREFGLETDYKPGKAVESGGIINTVPGTGLTALAPFATGTLFYDGGDGFGPIRTSLQALERDGLINTLAEPNLTAISGETAGFLAGGEFPVPVGRDQDGNITLEFKQFGVSLNFTPTVLSRDRISLQLSTEVSAKSDADSVTLVNTIIPGLTVRRAETTVEMGSGGTIMIAGLIKSDTTDSLSSLPGIKDVPILGELFKSKSFARDESELVILVTPIIVKPFARQQAVRAEPPPVQGLTVPVSLQAPTQAFDKSHESLPDLPKKAEGGFLGLGTGAGSQAITEVFAGNLRRIYGSRAPALPGGQGGYGYIVD